MDERILRGRAALRPLSESCDKTDHFGVLYDLYLCSLMGSIPTSDSLIAINVELIQNNFRANQRLTPKIMMRDENFRNNYRILETNKFRLTRTRSVDVGKIEWLTYQKIAVITACDTG
jgi:hypothetical protein